MASTIAAVTTSGGGVVTTADASGDLNLLAGTTTVVALTTAGAAVTGTLSASGATTLATTLVVTAASNSLGVVINGRSSDNLGAMYFYANNGTTNHATITTSATEFRHSAVPAAAVQTFYTNASERMRIDSAGLVGIGTSSPTNRLDVVGNFGLNNNNAIKFKNAAGTYQTTVQWDSGDNILIGDSSNSTNSILKFYAGSASGQTLFYGNNTERLRIDSAGNVLIGTTTGNADARLTPSGGSTDSSPCIDFSKGSATTTTSQVYARFFCNNNATATGSITANGVSAATFTGYSDRRLKENITDLPSQLANIMALRPVEFDFKGYEPGEGHQIGFIAQDVQLVYPDVVGEGTDGMLTLSDMNKNDARLIKCIQEQQALIIALTDRIAALEAK